MFGELAPWVPMQDVIGRAWGDDSDDPARTVCGDRGPRWAYPDADGTHGRVLRASRMDHAAERTLEEPAPTVMASWNRGGNGEWVIRTNQDTRMGNGDTKRYERTQDRPAPTVTTNAGLWEHHSRPATSVQGDPRLPKPGVRRDRAGGEHQQDGALKLTEAEGLVLQGFRPDYPVKGNKSKRWEQIGNAIPPLMAAHVVAAAARLDSDHVREALEAAA